MSWIPPDLSQACAVYTTVTTCAPSTFIFLKLIASLFGRSRDDNNNNSNDFGDYFSYTLPHNNIHEGRHYDFIVIGAGSAGCVVANRLTEVPDWKVLLVEAGPEEPEVADVPAFAPTLQRSNIDWNYSTQPSPKSCRSRPNGGCQWTRGKVMGGSSTLNFMIYMRGSPLDYDEWAAQGNPGWKYKDVLPYFIKSEDNRNPEAIESYYHGTGGYQTVERFPYQDANVPIVIQGFTELGLEELDLTAERQIGVMLSQHTTRDGERLSTNGAFIRPIRYKRPNLEVRTSTMVTKILIDPKTKVAYGIELRSQNGKFENVYADKEVILSAGAINSPQVLMLSGVGPSEHLQSLGIQVIQDLSVGYNLQDHTTIDGVVFALTNLTATSVSDEQRLADTEFFKQSHRGPLASNGPVQINALVQTKFAGAIRPDIQYSFYGTDLHNMYTDADLTYRTSVLPLSYYDALTVRPILLSPRSRGVVMLNTSDPIFGAPLIFANTFKERVDLLTMVEGIKQSLNLLRTDALQKVGMQLVDVPLPACAQYPFGSDDYWACVAMEYTTTIFHPVGTCKMGPKNDKNAVVDSTLKVYGVENLRVIDSSIMPFIPRGNTNAPTIMIAEKGSDYIKARWLTTGDVYFMLNQYDVTEKMLNSYRK